ncbi:Peroxisomal targeting signal 1 receptor [Gryllus bimaculatus]|nr:Peroxisomal targeting signal 1 receptor [Gryllus bimaculatus]
MALRDLMEGECGRPNALSRLTSHFVHDHTHRDDGLRRGVPHTEGLAGGDSDQWAQQFIGENSPQTFRMDSLLQEMREIESSGSLHAPVQAPGVAALAASDPTSLAAEDMAWAEQYLESGKQFDEEPCEAEVWNMPNLEVGESANNSEVFELGFGPQWAEEYLQSSQRNIDVDENWSETFDDLNQGSELQETANHLLNTVQDPNINASKFMKFMKQIGEGKITIEDGEVIGVPDGEETEDIILSETENDLVSTAGVKVTEMKDIDSSISSDEGLISEKQSSDDTAEYSKKLWSKLQNEWEKIFKSGEETTQPWVTEFSDYYDPFKDYPFEENNPMKEHSNALEEGKKRLEEGDLASAVLCFEAAVTNDFENSEAWELLGISQAENEQDPAAISALKNCLKLNPGNLRALMALAVSYTNESYQNQACLVLKEWLRQNKDYCHLVPDESSTSKSGVASSFLTFDTHKEVQDLYIAAARLHPRGNIDADVQCGLGVLFNLSNEYDKAVDCFKTALQVKPNDPRMWNRLGATLANGDRSVEAVEAYDHALQLAPGYIRARYNLGITCLNLGAHKEAAEHLLTALNQQAQARGVEEAPKSWSAMSDGIWSTLRLVVSLLDRRDLHDAVDSRNLVELNRAILEAN